MQPTLEGFPLVVPIQIQWGDLDAYGHVNNVVYLRWFEHARCVYGQKVGVEVVSREKGIGALVASVNCKYLRQISFPGNILAGIRVSRLSIGSVSLECTIADAQTKVPVAEASCDAVLYDYSIGQPVPVPDKIRLAVQQLEGREFTL